MDTDGLKELTGNSQITEYYDYGMPKPFFSSDTLFIMLCWPFLYCVVTSHQASLPYRSGHPKSRILAVGVWSGQGSECTLQLCQPGSKAWAEWPAVASLSVASQYHPPFCRHCRCALWVIILAKSTCPLKVSKHLGHETDLLLIMASDG